MKKIKKVNWKCKSVWQTISWLNRVLENLSDLRAFAVKITGL